MQYTITFQNLSGEQVNVLGNALARVAWVDADPFMRALQAQVAEQEAAARAAAGAQQPPERGGGAHGEPGVTVEG